MFWARLGNSDLLQLASLISSALFSCRDGHTPLVRDLQPVVIAAYTIVCPAQSLPDIRKFIIIEVDDDRASRASIQPGKAH